MDLEQVIQIRRSVRKYSGENVSEEKINLILKAGLLAPSGKGIRPWEFILVRNREMLNLLAQCRKGQAAFLKNADAVIVVVADTHASDTWVEDCAVVMAQMHLMATSIGVGSCWVQGRLRDAAPGIPTGCYVAKLLGIPENYALEAILSLGVPGAEFLPRELGDALLKKVHREVF